MTIIFRSLKKFDVENYILRQTDQISGFVGRVELQGGRPQIISRLRKETFQLLLELRAFLGAGGDVQRGEDGGSCLQRSQVAVPSDHVDGL